MTNFEKIKTMNAKELSEFKTPPCEKFDRSRSNRKVGGTKK